MQKKTTGRMGEVQGLKAAIDQLRLKYVALDIRVANEMIEREGFTDALKELFNKDNKGNYVVRIVRPRVFTGNPLTLPLGELVSIRPLEFFYELEVSPFGSEVDQIGDAPEHPRNQYQCAFSWGEVIGITPVTEYPEYFSQKDINNFRIAYSRLKQ